MSKEDGGAAFPMKGLETRNGQRIEQIYERGMTLRDYFAGKALQGELASQSDDGTDYETMEHQIDLAGWCYEMADFMLEARSK